MSESERVVDYGVNEDGVPWVITEKGGGNNIPRTKYVGVEIPDSFKAEITRNEETPAVAETNPDKYSDFQSAISQQKVDNPRNEYIEGSQSGENLDFKLEKGAENTDSKDNLHPERFAQNQAEDIQINATDTYQEIKPPDSIEDESTNTSDIDFGNINIPKKEGGI